MPFVLQSEFGGDARQRAPESRAATRRREVFRDRHSRALEPRQRPSHRDPPVRPFDPGERLRRGLVTRVFGVAVCAHRDGYVMRVPALVQRVLPRLRRLSVRIAATQRECYGPSPAPPVGLGGVGRVPPLDRISISASWFE